MHYVACFIDGNDQVVCVETAIPVAVWVINTSCQSHGKLGIDVTNSNGQVSGNNVWNALFVNEFVQVTFKKKVKNYTSASAACRSLRFRSIDSDFSPSCIHHSSETKK